MDLANGTQDLHPMSANPGTKKVDALLAQVMAAIHRKTDAVPEGFAEPEGEGWVHLPVLAAPMPPPTLRFNE